MRYQLTQQVLDTPSTGYDTVVLYPCRTRTSTTAPPPGDQQRRHKRHRTPWGCVVLHPPTPITDGSCTGADPQATLNTREHFAPPTAWRVVQSEARYELLLHLLFDAIATNKPTRMSP